MNTCRRLAALGAMLLFVGCVQSCPSPPPQEPPAESTPQSTATPWYSYEVVTVYPHDPEAFTQGLDWDNGAIYEGTGLYGRSSLRQVDLDSGQVVQQHDLAKEFFGEGIAVVENRIVQLTWTTHTGFIYDRKTFQELSRFSYLTQGWGLTHDGRQLIMSDGSATLQFLHPATFEVLGKVAVHDGATQVKDLNELEYVRGEIFANIWKTDKIARIRPETGEVIGWIDLSGLLTSEEDAHADVLNGIMYDPENNRLFVTGKLWPKLFELRLIPKKTG